MNILFVTETYLPFIAGVSSSSDSIARYMVSQGHKVVLVNPRPIIKKKVEVPPNLKLVYTPSIPDLFYKGKPQTVFPLGLPVINKTIRENKFDVIHIQEPGSLGISALILSKIYKIPTVGMLHFTPEQVGRMLPGKPEFLSKPIMETYIKYIYNKYSAIAVPTQTFVDFLKSIGVDRPIEVVSNGVDTKKFYQAGTDLKLRKKYEISEDDIVFFFLGRLDGDKNVATLVRAMPHTDKNVRLVIVGNGKLREKLHGLAENLGVSEKITWVDHITDAEMPGFYHLADVFTIMSPYEVQSIVTLQALASGLPVICADKGALPELCHNGVNGYLVDVYDDKTLAGKMNILAKDENLRKKFGEESRKMSLVHHKPDVLHKLELLYENVKTNYCSR
ncbi:MAG TPA: glycosyltransferase [Candidatus Saccharimonadales bacterium]|nr:glycosyltransferase [Candidatus Saccharimonadales bacterium]